MGGDETPGHLPGACRIERASPPGEEDRERADPTEIGNEEKVEAAEERNRGANGVERIDGVVLREARIAEDVAGGAPQRQEPDGESGEGCQIAGRVLGARRIAIQN